MRKVNKLGATTFSSETYVKEDSVCVMGGFTQMYWAIFARHLNNNGNLKQSLILDCNLFEDRDNQLLQCCCGHTTHGRCLDILQSSANLQGSSKLIAFEVICITLSKRWKGLENL